MGPVPKKRQDAAEESHQKQSLSCKGEMRYIVPHTSRRELLTISRDRYGAREGSQEVTV